MEPKFLLSSCNLFPCTAPPLPLCARAHLGLEKAQFLGQSLLLFDKNGSFGGGAWRNPIRVPLEPLRAAVKRRKELPFDNVIQKDKKLKLVLKLRKLLVEQPDRIMSLRELGKYRKELGLKDRGRFIALLKKFPGVFDIVEEGAFSLQFKLTPEAERLYFEELRVRNEMEDLLVIKLRKLLMMTLEKRILLSKLAHIAADLGLPKEFRDTICKRYPQYYKVVPTEAGPALELTHWDPELAVTAAELSEEDNRAREAEERNLIFDRPPKFNRVKLPKGLQLTKGETRKISRFRDIPYTSPYSDFSHLKSGTIEKEKHACAVVHEMLSLTIEKRTLVDHLTHFREEFRFSQQLRGMLIRHPDMFYVSLKGDRDSVFLREAYRDAQLIEKDRLLVVKEKLRSLVTVTRFPRRGAAKKGINGEDETRDRKDTGSEDEDYSSAGDSDEDDDGDEDRWDDDDEDTPPDFNDNDASIKIPLDRSFNRADKSTKNSEKVTLPTLPDGRPRERW